MKLVHLSNDNVFLDYAFPMFEAVYPGANEAVIFSSATNLENVRKVGNPVVIKPKGLVYKKPRLRPTFYDPYDLVVVHSLNSVTLPEIRNIPSDKPIIWIGWGFDYYPDLLSRIPLLLEHTKKLSSRLEGLSVKSQLARLVRLITRSFAMPTRKIKAVEKMAVFSPVLPSEYDLVAGSRHWKQFPAFSEWNYGTLKENFVKGFEGEAVDGDAILIGNSATYTGNHVECLELLDQLGVHDRQIVAPLSYGSAPYAEQLAEIGRKSFGGNFEPLMSFMPIEDYVATIRKCGYVIMNHVRQQAVGNILIMIYLGARIFVRQENPVYPFFREMGVVLSTVQELEVQGSLLETPLTDAEQRRNREIISDHWSRERAHELTRAIVAKALAQKGISVSDVLPEVV